MLAIDKASPFRTLVGGLQGLILGAVCGLLLACSLTAVLGPEGWWARPVEGSGPCGMIAAGAAAGLVIGSVLGALGAGLWVFVVWVNSLLLSAGICWLLRHEFGPVEALQDAIREGALPGSRELARELAGGAVAGGLVAAFLGLGFWAAILTLGGLALGVVAGTAIGGFIPLVAAAVLGTCGGADLGRMLFRFLERMREKAEELMEE